MLRPCHAGGICSELINEAAEGKLAYVSGGISLVVGTLGRAAQVGNIKTHV